MAAERGSHRMVSAAALDPRRNSSWGAGDTVAGRGAPAGGFVVDKVHGGGHRGERGGRVATFAVGPRGDVASSRLATHGHTTSDAPHRVGWCRHRFTATADSQHTHPVAPNVLQREFGRETTNTASFGDAMYTWTWAGSGRPCALRGAVGWAGLSSTTTTVRSL